MRLLAGGFKLAVAVLILVGAAAAYRYQIKTSPRAKRQPPPRQAKLVQVIPLEEGNCTTVVKAMGPVIPAQQVTLHPQVAGQIVELSDAIIPGGIIRAGEKIVAIDRRDYEILVQQRQADVANATKNLKIEQGNQAVARQEYELLGEVVAEEDQELVLREPQLASARAALESAQAALRRAKLDLARCEITAPFNAIVREKHVDLGATVTSGSQLVTLIATDETWVELKVPVDELKWLTIPRDNGETGSSVTIYNTLAWGKGRCRTGQVVRLYGELEPAGKFARLLVAVDDPFCLKDENRGRPQLLLGSMVQAEVQGATLASVFPVRWEYLRDNNRAVWIVGQDNQLEIRPVEIAYRGPEEVFIETGLSANERLVVTDIAAAVPGMPLRIAGAPDEKAEPGAGPG
ncbi:MAG: efflux RND transporter periplasmic adaptor subunit [Sedimentisphaerales bacterium]|nr:efflux RND transporter periplasmic adaptor subunit [Sedimentisphaerales bacterium]